MIKLISGLAAVMAAAALATLDATAAECPFDNWRSYMGTSLFRTADKTAYLWITDRASIDADGAPKSYHPDDVGKPCSGPGLGLDCPANAGYPDHSYWSDVLVRDPDHPDQAYVQTSGAAQGYFVSMTALQDARNSNERDPARYVDASTIPYVVFPKPFYDIQGTGKTGDLGAAYHLVTKKWTPFVVSDIGPAEPLGEASIALFQALGGDQPDPRTGGGIIRGKVLYMVFPRSVDLRPRAWPITPDEIAFEVNALLSRIGGTAVLEACATTME